MRGPMWTSENRARYDRDELRLPQRCHGRAEWAGPSLGAPRPQAPERKTARRSEAVYLFGPRADITYIPIGKGFLYLVAVHRLGEPGRGSPQPAAGWRGKSHC